MQHYTKLKVWVKAHALALEVYKATARFPPAERFARVSQLRRSCSGIASNIAEGAGRSSDAAFASFLDIAAGSASETQYQLLLARDLAYLTDETYLALSERADELRRMLTSLRVTARGRNPRRSAVSSDC